MKDWHEGDRANLEAWASKMERAVAALRLAQDALAADKTRRASSLLARLTDWMTTTPAEAALQAAQDDLRTITSGGQDAARQWITQTAYNAIQSDLTTASRYHEQKDRVTRAAAQRDPLQKWLGMAQKAKQRLASAQRACQSASGSAVIDALTENKAISVMAYSDNSNARTAVAEANGALRNLATAFPNHADRGSLEVPEGLLALVMNLSDLPGAGACDWLNMSRFDDTGRRCGALIERLSPLLARLSREVDAAQALVSQETDALHAIAAPYIDLAIASVPVALRPTSPVFLASD